MNHSDNTASIFRNGCLRWFLAFGFIGAIMILALSRRSYQLLLHNAPQVLGAPTKWVVAGIATSIIALGVFTILASSIDFNLQWDTPALFQFRRYGQLYTWFDVIIAVSASATLATIGAFFFANGYFDQSLPQAHWSSVVDKSISHSSRGGDSYYLQVSDWLPNEPPMQVQVNAASYNSHQIGQPIALSTKSGFLGAQWLLQMQ